MLDYKKRIHSLEQKLEETLMISVERAEEIKRLLKNIEDLNQTIEERKIEIK